MTVESILNAIETRYAAISVRTLRQFEISYGGAKYAVLFITLDEDSEPVGNDDQNYFVDEAGNERSLTVAEEAAVAAALNRL